MRKVEVNVRIVAATNRNLDTVVNDGVFRSDLLYRINGFQISLPPLRERPEDIDPLARHLLKQIAGTTPPDLTEEAFTALRLYAWPGNVRQLKNCLERAVILSNNGTDYAFGVTAGSYAAGSGGAGDGECFRRCGCGNTGSSCRASSKRARIAP